MTGRDVLGALESLGGGWEKKRHPVQIGGHRTSLSLEGAFWEALETISRDEQVSRSELVEFISKNKDPALSLTAAVRIYVLGYLNHARRL